jgi:hypothetical protein
MPVYPDPQWGLRVADYRAYAVGSDGHFVGFEPIVCDCDDQAIERAKGLLDAHDIEVWCGDRLVIHLKRKSQ